MHSKDGEVLFSRLHLGITYCHDQHIMEKLVSVVIALITYVENKVVGN